MISVSNIYINFFENVDIYFNKYWISCSINIYFRCPSRSADTTHFEIQALVNVKGNPNEATRFNVYKLTQKYGHCCSYLRKRKKTKELAIIKNISVFNRFDKGKRYSLTCKYRTRLFIFDDFKIKLLFLENVLASYWSGRRWSYVRAWHGSKMLVEYTYNS